MNGVAIVIVVIGAIYVGLFAAAKSISRLMVCRGARRLPTPLSVRMEEEWLAELDTIQDRMGKLAFGVALLLTRRKAFVNPSEYHDASVIQERSGHTLGGWKSLLLIPTVALALLAYGLSFLSPVQYKSAGVVILRESDIPEDIARSLITGKTNSERMQYLEMLALSRSNLTQIARTFEAHLSFKPNSSMDERVQQLRRNIKIDKIAIDSPVAAAGLSYTGSDPAIVRKVTGNLLDLFMKKDAEVRESKGKGTVVFLENELTKTATELAEFNKLAGTTGASDELHRLKHEMLQSSYKSLYTKLEAAKLTLSLEVQSRGGQLMLLDDAGEAHQVGPDRLLITGIGALSGAMLGAAAFFGVRRRQRRVLA